MNTWARQVQAAIPKGAGTGVVGQGGLGPGTGTAESIAEKIETIGEATGGTEIGMTAERINLTIGAAETMIDERETNMNVSAALPKGARRTWKQQHHHSQPCQCLCLLSIS